MMVTLSETKSQVVPVVPSNVAYADVSCVVINPIGIIKIRDMHFGSIISGQSGEITLPPDGGQPVTSGGVMMETSNNLVSTATFQVSDNNKGSSVATHYYTGFTITLPTGDVILANESGQSMRVSNFTSVPAASSYGTFSNGEGTISVGATLYVTEQQGVGQYASKTSFPVTVNYY